MFFVILVTHLKSYVVEHSDSLKKKFDSVRFTLTNRFFDSIRQFDKNGRLYYIGVMIYFLSIAEFLFSNQ